VHRISHAPVAFDTALGYFPETNVRISFIYFSIGCFAILYRLSVLSSCLDYKSSLTHIS
jgi:hypothetical protein